MAQIRFFRGTTLPNSIQDGNIYIVPNNGPNTGDIYIDINADTRLKINPVFAPEIHTTNEWNTLDHSISTAGKIYIYSDKNDGSPAIKIGDGAAYIVDLPFREVVTADEKTCWNNKVTAFMEVDPNTQKETETLILSSD